MDEASSVHPKLQKLIPKIAKIIYEEVEIEEFQPTGSRILCRPMEQDLEELESGLIIKRNAENKPRLHLVLKTGPGRPRSDGGRDPIPVNPGDVIITDGYIGHPVEYNHENFRLIRAGDVMAVYESSAGAFS